MIGRARAEPTDLAERLEDARSRIAAAAARAGRSPDDVRLVAVSKTFPSARVVEAMATGQMDFGESRAQELRDKAREVVGDPRWHFVGRLQRNKVKHVVGVACLVHSVDSEDLAVEVAARARRTGHVQPVLVQVNVGSDPRKAGVDLEDAHRFVERLRLLEGLRCEGLMTIPPMDVDPRPLYARLRGALDAIRDEFPEVRHLSMGMSKDYEVAVEEGATLVRLGEAVFGPRPQPA
jgi:PLP dependent protein